MSGLSLRESEKGVERLNEALDLIHWVDNQDTKMATAKLLLYVLVAERLMNPGPIQYTMFHQRQELADACEYHRRTLDRALNHLRTLGLIRSESVYRDGKRGRYGLNITLAPTTPGAPTHRNGE